MPLEAVEAKKGSMLFFQRSRVSTAWNQAKCHIRVGEQGYTLIETLIAAAIGIFVLMGLGSLYVSALKFYEEGSAKTEVQRQAMLVLQEMAKQILPAEALSLDTCNGVADSLRVINADGAYCFYQDAQDQLLEDRPGGTLNMLKGALAPLTLTPGSLTFCFDPPDCSATSGAQVIITFTVGVGIGVEPMTYSVSLMKRN